MRLYLSSFRIANEVRLVGGQQVMRRKPASAGLAPRQSVPNG
jgi:hypothetical protein